MYKIKEGLQLRKIGSHYMIVEACNGQVNMSNVYSLNDTAALIWQHVGKGCSDSGELAAAVCEAYAVDMADALRDVERQLAEWKAFGLIE